MTNVAIIGTGWVTHVHIESLNKIPGVRIAAIAGRNAVRLAELTDQTGATGYENYLQMLQKEKLDAAFICMPPHVHGEIEAACAEYVPAVLLEKPINNNLEQAIKIGEIFDKAGTIVSVGYMNRYRTLVERTREIFANPEQPPIVINGWWINPMPGPLWWRKMSESGGQFVEQCTHVVDAARWIAGEITEVSAFHARGFVTDVDNYDIDDAMTVNVRYASGAIGSFTTGCFPTSRSAINDVGLLLYGREVRCQIKGWTTLEVEHRKGHTETISENEDIFLRQSQLFLQAAAEKRPELIRSSYADGLQTLKVTLAANESSRTGKSVLL